MKPKIIKVYKLNKHTEGFDEVEIDTSGPSVTLYFRDKVLNLKIGDYITLIGRKTNEPGYTSCICIINNFISSKGGNDMSCIVVRASYNSIHRVGDLVFLNAFVIEKLVTKIETDREIKQTSELVSYQKQISGELSYIAKEARYYKYLNSVVLTNPTTAICQLLYDLYKRFKPIEEEHYTKKHIHFNRFLVYKNVIQDLYLIKNIIDNNPILKSNIYHYMLGVNKGDKQSTENLVFSIDYILNFAHNKHKLQLAYRVVKNHNSIKKLKQK